MNLNLLKDWKSKVIEQCPHKKVTFKAEEFKPTEDHISLLDKFCKDLNWFEINNGWFEHDQVDAKRLLSFAMSGRFGDDVILLPVQNTYAMAEQLVDMLGEDTKIYCNALFNLTQKPYLRAWCGLTYADITVAFAFIQHNMLYVLLLEE